MTMRRKVVRCVHCEDPIEREKRGGPLVSMIDGAETCHMRAAGELHEPGEPANERAVELRPPGDPRAR